MYGQYDWMNSQAGYAAFEELEGVEAKYKIIPQAGHNVFLDNSDVFDSEVIHFLSDETTINGENRIWDESTIYHDTNDINEIQEDIHNHTGELHMF